MPPKPFRAPVGVMVGALAAAALLLGIDLSLINEDWSPVRNDLRLLIEVAWLGAAIWAATRWATGKTAARMKAALACDAPTVPLQPMRIVATAPTRPAQRYPLLSEDVGPAAVAATPATGDTAPLEEAVPADLDVYLAETAEIYELGRQAGLAERDDPSPSS